MTSLDNTSMDTDALTNEDQGSSESKAPQSPSSSVIPLSVFPWAESVTQLPTATASSGRGPGWVNFSDLTYHAPLGLWITLISVTQSVPAEYGRYFEEPQQLSKLLHQLPLRVSKLLTKGRRDIAATCRLLEQLAEMGLVRIDGSLNRNQSRAYVFLSRSASLVDTSTAEPRRSYFLNTARASLQTRSYRLDCLADVDKYWFELRTICLQTKMILVVKRKSESVCSEDVHGLPYTLEQQKTLRQPEAARKYNSLGFGAGGLPPLTHSHLARNWCQGSLELQEEDEEEEEGVELGEEPVAEGYGPGMELIRLPKAGG